MIGLVNIDVANICENWVYNLDDDSSDNIFGESIEYDLLPKYMLNYFFNLPNIHKCSLT